MRFAALPLIHRRLKDLVYRSLFLITLTIAAWIEAMTGYPAKALELLDRGQRLSPRDPTGWFMAVVLALATWP